MTRIDPSRQLAVIAKEQLLRLRARTQATGQLGNAKHSLPHDAARLVMARVLALDPADPHRQRKAVRIYLESELGREFGPALLNDSGFGRMLDAIEARLREDPETAAAADAVGEWLVARALP